MSSHFLTDRGNFESLAGTYASLSNLSSKKKGICIENAADIESLIQRQTAIARRTPEGKPVVATFRLNLALDQPGVESSSDSGSDGGRLADLADPVGAEVDLEPVAEANAKLGGDSQNVRDVDVGPAGQARFRPAKLAPCVGRTAGTGLSSSNPGGGAPALPEDLDTNYVVKQEGQQEQKDQEKPDKEDDAKERSGKIQTKSLSKSSKVPSAKSVPSSRQVSPRQSRLVKMYKKERMEISDHISEALKNDPSSSSRGYSSRSSSRRRHAAKAVGKSKNKLRVSSSRKLTSKSQPCSAHHSASEEDSDSGRHSDPEGAHTQEPEQVPARRDQSRWSEDKIAHIVSFLKRVISTKRPTAEPDEELRETSDAFEGPEQASGSQANDSGRVWTQGEIDGVMSQAKNLLGNEAGTTAAAAPNLAAKKPLKPVHETPGQSNSQSKSARTLNPFQPLPATSSRDSPTPSHVQSRAPSRAPSRPQSSTSRRLLPLPPTSTSRLRPEHTHEGASDLEDLPPITAQGSRGQLRSSKSLMTSPSPREFSPMTEQLKSLRDVRPTLLRDAMPTMLRDVTPTRLRDVAPTTLRDITPTTLRDVTPTTLRDVTPTMTLLDVRPVACRDVNPLLRAAAAAALSRDASSHRHLLDVAVVHYNSDSELCLRASHARPRTEPRYPLPSEQSRDRLVLPPLARPCPPSASRPTSPSRDGRPAPQPTLTPTPTPTLNFFPLRSFAPALAPSRSLSALPQLTDHDRPRRRDHLTPTPTQPVLNVRTISGPELAPGPAALGLVGGSDGPLVCMDAVLLRSNGVGVTSRGVPAGHVDRACVSDVAGNVKEPSLVTWIQSMKDESRDVAGGKVNVACGDGDVTRDFPPERMRDLESLVSSCDGHVVQALVTHPISHVSSCDIHVVQAPVTHPIGHVRPLYASEGVAPTLPQVPSSDSQSLEHPTSADHVTPSRSPSLPRGHVTHPHSHVSPPDHSLAAAAAHYQSSIDIRSYSTVLHLPLPVPKKDRLAALPALRLPGDESALPLNYDALNGFRRLFPEPEVGGGVGVGAGAEEVRAC